MNDIKIIENIRNNYTEKEVTKLDELKALNKKVHAPAKTFAYVYGSISSLILGTGMCFAMKVIGASLPFAMPLGISVGVIGIGLTLTTYPLYNKILNKRKRKYANKILEISDDLLNK